MSGKNGGKNKLKIKVVNVRNGCIIKNRKGGKEMYINFKKSVSNEELRKWKVEKELLIFVGKVWFWNFVFGGVIVLICR